MAISITGYVDPGTYQQEVVVSNSSSVTSIPFNPCIIGPGWRNKQSTNEAVMRGLVTGEAASFAITAPYTNTFLSRAMHKPSTITVLKDGNALTFGTEWTLQNANVTGTFAADTTDLSTFNTIGISLDGSTPISMTLAASAPVHDPVYEATGTGLAYTATIHGVATLAAVTTTQLAACINAVLIRATSGQIGAPGYGPTYGLVASAPTARTILITSPTALVQSDVAIWDTRTATTTGNDMVYSGSAPLSFAATTVRVLSASLSVPSTLVHTWSLHAKTTIALVAAPGSSTYAVAYIGIDDVEDPLLFTGVQAISRVGNYASVSNYANGVDYVLGTNSVAWDGTTWVNASISGVVGPTYDLSTNNKLSISVDGKAAVTVTVPLGAAKTAQEIVDAINEALATSVIYGFKYINTAVVHNVTGVVMLNSPSFGYSSTVELSAPATLNATQTVFGLTSTQLPYSIRGSGQMPLSGQIYYATYTYTRPTTDYDVCKQYFSTDQAWSDLGIPSATNKVALAVQVAFQNGAPSVFVIQANDSYAPGYPTVPEMQAALEAASTKQQATEIVMLDTRQQLQVDTFSFVCDECSPQIQRPRRGWFGMASGTVIGDKDTPGTYLYTAAVTLQPAADSPGRGRMFVMAPSDSQIQITDATGQPVYVSVDGTFIAVAVAGLFSGRASVAASLVNKNITGFVTDTFPTYLPAERRILASGGVCVVTNQGGRLTLIDPISTERALGRLPQFEEPSASSQKDNIMLNVNDAINGNCLGVVPSDLSDFIFTIKSTIGTVLSASISSGAIGPYRSEDGNTRDLNYATDIQVYQMKTDPRKYTFRYFYMLRYPAKWFFGEYSVDNPFFALNSQAGLTA
jgi:hypothetical protein